MLRFSNWSTTAGSGVPINVDEPLIVPEAQDFSELIQENLAPSDVNSRQVDFELVTNKTIILHESPVSSDANDLFNSTNFGPTNSSVF